MTVKAKRKTTEERIKDGKEALANILSNQSVSNFSQVIAEFMARGIPADEIRPKENVFTYRAWQGLGRQVRRGEKGVKLTTWVVKPDKDDDKKFRKFPVYSTVFHVSQTDKIEM